MNKIYHTIAGITICLETPWEEQINPEFAEFCGKEGKNLYRAVFQETENLDNMEELPVYKNQGFAVFLNHNGGFVRRFHLSTDGERPYAIMKADFQKKLIQVNYLSGNEWCFGSSRGDFFYIGWENILLHENRMILHAACVETPLGGILFSGSSGIGKSTQAELWCRHPQNKLINGDKPILAKEQDGWKTYGSPYAGSSKCHKNEKCDIRAIVMLKQAKVCSVRKLKAPEAFRKIYAQITMNSWDSAFVSKVSDLAADLIREVPIYELECTPDEEAVKMMYDTLDKG